jgi:hypothetical protein
LIPETRTIVAVVLMAAVGVFIALCFWPGRMNADTLIEIDQVRRGRYTDQHAPILQALWHLVYGAGVGPAYVLLGQILVFMAGTALILRAVFSRIGAAVATCLVSLFPPVMGTLGLVGRDTWFTSFFVLSLGAVAVAGGRDGGRRTAWLVLAVAASWLALAARQNAAAAVVVGLTLVVGLVLASRAGSAEPPRGLRFAVKTAAGALVLTLLLMGTQFGVVRVLDVDHAYPTGPLQVYDLAALSRQDHRNLFPTSVVKQRSIGEIERLSSIDTIIPVLVPGGLVRYPIVESDSKALSKAWKDSIADDPLGYLVERTQLFVKELALSGPSLVSYHTVIDNNPFGYKTTFPGINDAANDYLGAFADDRNNNGGALYAVWLYLIAAIAIAVVFLRRWTWPALTVAATAIAALTYQVGIFFGIMGTIFRFEFPAVTFVAIGLAATAGVLWQRRRALVGGARTLASAPFAAAAVPFGTADRSTPLASDAPAAPRAGVVDRRLLAYPPLVLGGLLAGLAFWPGIVGADQNQTILQAQEGLYLDWWTAWGAIGLHWWQKLGLGLDLTYAALIAFVVAGSYLALRARLRRLWAALVTVVVLGLPPLHAQLSLLSRDGFFLGLSLLSVGLVGAQSRLDSRGARWAMAGALLAAIGATLCRQNAIVLVVALGVYLALRGRRLTLRSAGAAALAGVVASVAVFALVGVGNPAAGVRAVHPERAQYIYDLSAIATLADKQTFPVELVAGRRTGYLTKDVDLPRLQRDFQWPNVISVLGCGEVACPTDFASAEIARDEVELLKPAWFNAVIEHPFDYLWARVRLTGSQLGIVHRPLDAGPATQADPTNLGRPLEFAHGYDTSREVEKVFVGSGSTIPLDMPWLWQALVLILAAAILRRERTLRTAAGATALLLALASLLNLFGVGLTAPASAFRYLLLNLPSAVILLAIWAADAKLRRPRRAPAAATTEA